MELEGGPESLSITSQAELVRRLEELHKFQELSKKLWALPKKGHEVFTKPKVDRAAIINSILTPMDLGKLLGAMIELMQKNKRRFTFIRRDRLSIKEKLVYLKSVLTKGSRLEFEQILTFDPSQHVLPPEELASGKITDMIISFISILELARLNKVSLFQNEERSKIYIDVIETLENFDVNSANGFDEEDGTGEVSKAATAPPITMEAAMDAGAQLMQ